jgi:hypothetical protein
MHHRSAWWSVEIPDGWLHTEHPECVTFEPPSADSAFQISAHRKGSEDVTLEDLREFAGEIPLAAVSFPEFSGIHTRYSENDTYWSKWWLRCGSLMVHATYNCSFPDRGRDDTSVEFMLCSLAVTDATS